MLISAVLDNGVSSLLIALLKGGIYLLLILFFVFLFLSVSTILFLLIRLRTQHRRTNLLYKCGHCGNHRRHYQLVANPSDEIQSAKCQSCFLGAYTLTQPFPWMKYVDDFPRLSLLSYSRIIRAQRIIRKRQVELKSYTAWKRHWKSTYKTLPPVVNERKIEKRLAIYDMTEEEFEYAKSDFDSVRRFLNEPKL